MLEPKLPELGTDTEDRINAVCYRTLHPKWADFVADAASIAKYRLREWLQDNDPRSVQAVASTFALRASLNLVRAEKRHHRKRVQVEAGEEATSTWAFERLIGGDGGSAAEQIERNIYFKQRVEQARARLSPRQDLELKLFLRGYSQREVADILGIAESTVSKDMRRILTVLATPPDKGGGGGGGSGGSAGTGSIGGLGGSGNAGIPGLNSSGELGREGAPMQTLDRVTIETAAQKDELLRLILQLPAFREGGFWEEADEAEDTADAACPEEPPLTRERVEDWGQRVLFSLGHRLAVGRTTLEAAPETAPAGGDSWVDRIEQLLRAAAELILNADNGTRTVSELGEPIERHTVQGPRPRYLVYFAGHGVVRLRQASSDLGWYH